MKKNIIVAQSGGPTTAINASLYGVVKAAVEGQQYGEVYGALHGISGVIKEDFLNLSEAYSQGDELKKLLYGTPSSYLGSCRFKMPEIEEDSEIYQNVFGILEKYNVGAFFYIGGNDSMDTVDKLAAYAAKINSEIRFAGVPKTIDNDLVLTDHTPGYGSAAKYIACSMLEMAHDTAVYEAPCVTIVEIMGRDSGWLTAAAALASNKYNPTPQLIYLPEVDFHRADFMRDIKAVLEKTNNVVVAVSEGIHDENGVYLCAKVAKEDKFGHAQLSGVGKFLESLVKEELGIKCRSVELNILQRCAARIASKTDLDEAQALGEKAVEFTLRGDTGFMTAINRISNAPYTCEIGQVNLVDIANKAKVVPREWINEAGNGVTSELIEYIRPLIQGEVFVSYDNGLPVYMDISHLTKIEK